MSPWAVRCELNADALAPRHISTEELWDRAEREACRECGSGASVVIYCDAFGVHHLCARLLAGDALAVNASITDDSDGGGGGSASMVQPHAHELTVYLPDGASHKLVVLPPTTVLEVKQHVLRAVQGAAADAASAEEQSEIAEGESARPCFWQDEHCVQRQHIFVQGNEDELADDRSMDSLGSPPVLFLMVDTEASFMKRLESAATALRARLGGAKLRDLARCEAEAAEKAKALAAEAAEQAAEQAAEGVGVGVKGAGNVPQLQLLPLPPPPITIQAACARSRCFDV
jgi:hypothetical protein